MGDGGKGSSPRPYSVDMKTFDNNWNKIFSKNKVVATDEEEEAWKELERKMMSPSTEQMKKGTCGCGRSPTGNCCGWHGLSEQEYKERKELYESGRVDLHGREIK